MFISHIHTHTHTDRHTLTHTHTHTHTQTHTRARARAHARTHAHTFTLHTPMYSKQAGDVRNRITNECLNLKIETFMFEEDRGKYWMKREDKSRRAEFLALS